MVTITHVHMEGGQSHQHIAKVKWHDSSDNSTGTCTRADMVKHIEAGNKVYVNHGGRTVSVLVVNATPKYIRTFADGIWTDNLLALPKF